jgi:hypothetical protein
MCFKTIRTWSISRASARSEREVIQGARCGGHRVAPPARERAVGDGALSGPSVARLTKIGKRCELDGR